MKLELLFQRLRAGQFANVRFDDLLRLAKALGIDWTAPRAAITALSMTASPALSSCNRIGVATQSRINVAS